MKNIYSSNLCNKFSFDNLAEQTLSTNEWSDLNQYPTQPEIWRALGRIGSEKAPGPDGLNAFCFKNYWKYVEPYINRLVDDFFQENKM